MITINETLCVFDFKTAQLLNFQNLIIKPIDNINHDHTKQLTLFYKSVKEDLKLLFSNCDLSLSFHSNHQTKK